MKKVENHCSAACSVYTTLHSLSTLCRVGASCHLLAESNRVSGFRILETLITNCKDIIKS